jgi:ferritin-like metal-binding protein YciE
LAQISADLIRNYLDDALTFEKTSEEQLRRFAGEGDDEDVQAAFARHADETHRQQERLIERLKQVGGSATDAAHMSAEEMTPQILQTGRIPEERTVRHLIVAFGAETSETAFYEAFATVAEAAEDVPTVTLVRQIQAEEQRAAKKFFSFLSSRSKIAFNMLTPNELDPAVETKAFDNPVV